MKIRIEMSDEELRDILVTAGTSGCRYWAVTEHWPECAVDGTDIKFFERENEDVFLGLLTLEKMRAAPNKLAELCQQNALPIATLCNLLDEYRRDAIVADVLVQVALFGEVRYG